jgi:flavin-dependent dehydrogenase
LRGIYDEYDVVVVGGGISGALAATAASREGARTLLVERGGCLGGTLVLCGVGPMMTFHCLEEQVIRGLPGELVERLVAKGLSPGHIRDTTGYVHTVTPFDVEGMKQELEIMALEAGVKLLYGATVFGVEREENRITSLDIAAKSGTYKARGRVYVDATGDAEIAQRAGFPCRMPRVMQPATMVFRMAGVDAKAVRAYVRQHPEEFPRQRERLPLLDAADRLSLSGFIQSMEKGRERGEISVEREDLLFFESS